MKKSLSLLVAIAMVFSMFATLVSAAETTQSAGQKLQELGVIKGTANGLDEDKEWKRQDITILLARLLQVEDAAKNHANTHGFTDVDTKSYNGYISWAKENGYFTGESATVFGINKSITNQQFAAVLLRVLKVDVDYADAFEKAVELKLVSADLKATDVAIRGGIYESLLTALDYKIDGKKLGTILGLKGYEVSDVEVVKASATNSKTVKVEFNQDVKDVLASNFDVVKADDSAIQVIESVSTSGAVATIKLVDSLSSGKEYAVSATGVVSKDGEQTQGEKGASATFTYSATEPKTVEVTSTVVAYDSVVGYAIKDAQGNDITVDVDASKISVASSATDVVSVNGTELKALTKDGYSVVNVSVIIDEDGKTIESGNTVVKVQPSVAVVNGISELTLGTIGEDAVTSIFEKTNGVLKYKIVDNDKNVVTPTKVTFKSSNPSVLVVDTAADIQNSTTNVRAVKAGSATVTMTAEYNGKTVSKSVVITVKGEAKLTSIELSKGSVKLVDGANISETVKLTLKDQYGDVLKNTTATGSVKANNGNVYVDGSDVTNAVELTSDKLASGEVEFVLSENADGAASTVITVKVGTFSKTISASVVKAASLAGYIVEIDATKIDMNTVGDNALDNHVANVGVYQKDVNGNKIGVVDASDITIKADKEGTDAIVKVNGLEIETVKVGSDKVTVYVNNVKVATYTIQVVNTASTLTKVVQDKNAVTVKKGTDLTAVLFGTDKGDDITVDTKGAFVGYDQYGTNVALTKATKAIYSSNSEVVNNSGNAQAAGTAQLTVLINDAVYTITVKVTE